MPCNSVAIAQIRVTNLTRIVLNKLDTAAAGLLLAELAREVERLSGGEAEFGHRALVVSFRATGQQPWFIGFRSNGVQARIGAFGASQALAQQAAQIANTALEAVAAQLIAVLVRGDLVNGGCVITDERQTPDATVIAWRLGSLNGEVLVGRDGALAIRTLNGDFATGAQVIGVIGQLLQAAGVEWSGAITPERHRHDGPAEHVRVHGHAHVHA